MKEFLVKNKIPICHWGSLQKGTKFRGTIPYGYDIAIAPEDDYIVIDVDRHGDKDGFTKIPVDIKEELDKTFNYPTKNNGQHFWLRYTGNKKLPNKTSGIGIDLRCRGLGYVVFYKKGNFNDYLHEINKTSENLNKWIEEVFCYSNKQNVRKNKQRNIQVK